MFISKQYNDIYTLNLIRMSMVNFITKSIMKSRLPLSKPANAHIYKIALIRLQEITSKKRLEAISNPRSKKYYTLKPVHVNNVFVMENAININSETDFT